jgi:hypothetical protein
VNFLDCDCQQAFLIHGIAAVYGEIDQRGLELRDVGNCETIDIGDVDLDPYPGADQRTNKPRHAFYLHADIEYLRFEWLPASKRQQLSGQFRCPFHGLGNRIDIAAPAILRQIMSAKEIRRGKDDGQEIVEVVCHAAGELAHGFHLLRLTQRFLVLPALGDIDGLGNGADNFAMLVAQRTHRKIEIALAYRQMESHLDLDFFSLHHRGEGFAHRIAHALGAAEPGSFPKRLADHVDGVSANSR